MAGSRAEAANHAEFILPVFTAGKSNLSHSFLLQLDVDTKRGGWFRQAGNQSDAVFDFVTIIVWKSTPSRGACLGLR